MTVTASNSEVREISTEECLELLKTYNLEEQIELGSYHCGLFFGPYLVQIMSFGSERTDSEVKYQWEIYCDFWVGDFEMIKGSREKLIDFFIKQKDPYNIVSKKVPYSQDEEKDTDFHFVFGGCMIGSLFEDYENAGFSGITERKGDCNRFGEIFIHPFLDYEMLVKPFKGYIYKTTNLLNGKIYIGQHREDEFNSYYFGSGTVITAALKKYSRANFKVESIEWTQDNYFDVFQKKLNELEVKYISQFDSQNPKIGYNVLEGGQNDGVYLTDKKDLLWWNNGSENKLSKECPGEGWVQGFVKDTSNFAGNKFWNNGEVTVRAKECPGPRWVQGMVIVGTKVWTDGVHNKRMVSCPGPGWRLGSRPDVNFDRMSGRRWWNNGKENKASSECPGEGWVLGQLKKVVVSTAGLTWWNNGSENKLSKECPGEGWTRGQIKRSSENMTGQKGLLFWNNGVKNKRSATCPGEGWVRGALPLSKPCITPDVKWWNNGVKNTRSSTCPGPNWVLGKLPHKKKIEKDENLLV